MATLEAIKTFATELSPWAQLATVGADGEPDATPVHPCWEGHVLWLMCGAGSVKARNVVGDPKVALLLRGYGMGGMERWHA